MQSNIEHRGSCLCGEVQLLTHLDSHHVAVCHCGLCRTWGGGPLFAVESQNEVDFRGAEHIAIFSSSEWAERGFCKQCGTHLFYRLKEGGHYAIPVGLLEDNGQWQLEEQIFIEQKPAFYSFSQATRDLTGEEVFAQHTGN